MQTFILQMTSHARNRFYCQIIDFNHVHIMQYDVNVFIGCWATGTVVR